MKSLIVVVTLATGIGFINGTAYAADPVTDTCGISGLVSSYGLLGWTTLRSNQDSDGYGVGIAGKVNVCNVFGSSLNMQSDVYAEYSDITDGDMEGYNATSIGSVNHLYWRDPDSFAFGILFGTSHFAESYTDENDGINALIGADAHFYLGNFTLAAQGAYWNNFDTESSSASADIDEAWEVSAEGRYFLTDNFKLTGRVSYDYNLSVESDEKWKAWRFGGGAEYQFDSTPLSVFANYTRVEGDIYGDNMDSDIIKAGFTLHLNQDTLMAEDRNGASFSTPYVDSWTNAGVAWYR